MAVWSEVSSQGVTWSILRTSLIWALMMALLQWQASTQREVRRAGVRGVSMNGWLGPVHGRDAIAQTSIGKGPLVLDKW